MMQGGGKTGGNRKHSGRRNELEEYFAELGDDPVERDAGFQQPEVSNTGGAQEDLRRLKAYVSYLGSRISELPESRLVAPARQRPNYAAMTAGLATVLMVGIAAVFATRVLRDLTPVGRPRR
ncbi:hypothetical protein JNB71_01170 [Rhizobium herbae]|uniref:DUF3618 domain-containing protein n=1 Tax=Rhizobium herbae TaxID=508661 RepID=A0ABS7H562_9HYPH|nr:hypothetical protein [Rhizobium herbae]MBW9061920.1 hypothetical protein [Rhizobium herbae]